MLKKLICAAIATVIVLAGRASAAELTVAEFDEGVKKANELYSAGEDAKCLSHLKQLEIRARRSSPENHARLLVYMMRLSRELGLGAESDRIKGEIDSIARKIKDTQYLKNMHMALAAVYANSGALKDAGEQIKKSLKYGEAPENLFTYAMIMAKFGERGEAYKTLAKIFKLNSGAGEKNEEIVMNNMTAAIIALSFEDFARAREHIDAVMKALAETSDAGYFVYIYKSLLNNIFSYFEYNPLNLRYYEKMYAMAKEKGGRADAGLLAVKIAKVLADLGLYRQALVRLDDAAALLALDSLKLDDAARVRDMGYETLETIDRIAKIFIDCGHYDAAAKLLEDLVFIYEKKGNLKDSFDKIRSLALCKFRQNNPAWKGLVDELAKTCADLADTRELLLTRNFLGELLLETGEVAAAEKLFREVAAETENAKNNDTLAKSELSELYFTSGLNLAAARLRANDPEGAEKLVDSYIVTYETYRAQKKDLKGRRRRSGDTLTNFTVVVEFSVSDIAMIAGKLYFMKARLLFDKKDYENSYKMIAAAFALLKNTDNAKNFYEILNFIVTNEDKFKDRKLFDKFREIREQYDAIIRAANSTAEGAKAVGEESSGGHESKEKSGETKIKNGQK